VLHVEGHNQTHINQEQIHKELTYDKRNGSG